MLRNQKRSACANQFGSARRVYSRCARGSVKATPDVTEPEAERPLQPLVCTARIYSRCARGSVKARPDVTEPEAKRLLQPLVCIARIYRLLRLGDSAVNFSLCGELQLLPTGRATRERPNPLARLYPDTPFVIYSPSYHDRQVSGSSVGHACLTNPEVSSEN